MPGEVRRRTAADQQGQPSVRVSPPASQGEGAAVKANRMAANSAGASRQQSAHGFGESIFYELDPQTETDTGGLSHDFDFPMPDTIGLWLCEVGVDIDWPSSGHPLSGASSLGVAHVRSFAPGASYRTIGFDRVPMPLGADLTKHFDATVHCTTGELRINVTVGGSAGGDVVTANVRVVAYRLADLPPGVT